MQQHSAILAFGTYQKLALDCIKQKPLSKVIFDLSQKMRWVKRCIVFSLLPN